MASKAVASASIAARSTRSQRARLPPSHTPIISTMRAMPMAKPDQLGRRLERSGISENSDRTAKVASATGQRGSTFTAERASFARRRDRARIFASDFTDRPPRLDLPGRAPPHLGGDPCAPRVSDVSTEAAAAPTPFAAVSSIRSPSPSWVSSRLSPAAKRSATIRTISELLTNLL